MTKKSKYEWDLGIQCEWLLTLSNGKCEPLSNMFIGIKKNKIDIIEKWNQSLKKKCKKLLVADHHVALPGFVNSHTHLAMSLLRGLEDDVPFHIWLFKRILPLESKLVNAEFVKLGTELSALECTRFGVTTVNDMYFYAQTSAEVWRAAGLRGVFSQVMASFPLPEDKELGNDKEKLFLNLKKKYDKESRISVALGPHAPYSCDDNLLKNVAVLSSQFDSKIHIHLSETQNEVEESQKKYSKTPVERLQDLGVLGPSTICAHGVHLSHKDQKIIKESGASIVYNPDSNMKLGSGIAPISSYLKENINVGLGTDGAASNNDLSLFGAMDVGTKLQKLANSDNTAMLAEQALALATYNGAKALGLEKSIGSLEPGKCADITIINLKFPHLQPIHNIVSQLVYSAQGLEVETVICDGRILFHKNKYNYLNEKQILTKSQKYTKKITNALEKIKREESR